MPPKANPRRELSHLTDNHQVVHVRGLQVQDILEVALSFLDLQCAAQLHTLGAVSTLWARASQAAAGPEGRTILPMRRLRQSIDSIAGPTASSPLSPQYLKEVEALKRVLNSLSEKEAANDTNKRLKKLLHAFATKLPAELTGIKTDEQRTPFLTITSHLRLLSVVDNSYDKGQGDYGKDIDIRFALGELAMCKMSVEMNNWGDECYVDIALMPKRTRGDRLVDDTVDEGNLRKRSSCGWECCELCANGGRWKDVSERMDEFKDALRTSQAHAPEDRTSSSNSELVAAIQSLDDKLFFHIFRMLSFVLPDLEYRHEFVELLEFDKEVLKVLHKMQM